jgi:hypothetical protein
LSKTTVTALRCVLSSISTLHPSRSSIIAITAA